MIEFHSPETVAFSSGAQTPTGCQHPSKEGQSLVDSSLLSVGRDTVEVPFPVEYKRGKRRRWDNDEVQLCAQALCLEEMLGVPVPAGAIFHIKSKRRREVVFTDTLRKTTEETARRVHELVASGVTPPPVLMARCRGCSLHDLCMPELFSQRGKIARYENALWKILPSADP